MTLYILQPGLQPLGQFDFLDTDLASVTGGQFGVFSETNRANTSTEKAAADVFDGYVNDQIDAGTDSATRPVLQLADGTDGAVPRYLLDEGVAGYGTLFGELIGNPVGLTVTGTALGPNTAQGSGKVTAWSLPGLFAVSLDACDADVVPTTAGTNQYDTPLPGESLYCGAATAQLTRTDAGLGYKVAAFVELTGNGSLVNTPNRLVGATETLDRVVIQYLGAMHSVSQ